MKRYIYIILFILFLLPIFSCKGNEGIEESHIHTIVPATCTDVSYCSNCGEILGQPLGHDYEEKIITSCDKDGVIIQTCKVCKKQTQTIIPPTGHEYGDFIEGTDATCTKDGIIGHYHCDKCNNDFDSDYKLLDSLVIKSTGHNFGNLIPQVDPTCVKEGSIPHYHCDKCNRDFDENFEVKPYIGIPMISHNYINGKCTICSGRDPNYDVIGNNGFAAHGKLSVNGPDLVDKNGEKFQLIGLSTHGLQWCGDFINYDTFKNIRDSFGINVIRLSLYPDEGGYCDCTPQFKETLYQRVANGIKYATSLDMYVILDWHMLGAENPLDKDPNYYREEAKAYFLRVLEEFPDNDNLLLEIMNEPQPPTTHEQCKEYANWIIPSLREKTDAVILVGGHNWSGLSSVLAWRDDRLEYDNIMYTLHFYAGDKESSSPVKNLYKQGVPIFVSEHGGMNNDGDGPIAKTYITDWWNTLDSCNISYVAWNISNTQCSASIFKYKTKDIYSIKNDNLKEWGIYYRNHVRSRFGLPKYEEE